MVTCVDVCGFNVMSASLDGTVALWDLRSSDAHQTITAVSAAGSESVSGGSKQPWPCSLGHCCQPDLCCCSAGCSSGILGFAARSQTATMCACTPVLQPCLRNGAMEPWQSMGVVKAAMRGAPYDRLVAAATVRVSDVWGLCKLLFSCVPQQPQHDRGADLNGPA